MNFSMPLFRRRLFFRLQYIEVNINTKHNDSGKILIRFNHVIRLDPIRTDTSNFFSKKMLTSTEW